MYRHSGKLVDDVISYYGSPVAGMQILSIPIPENSRQRAEEAVYSKRSIVLAKMLMQFYPWL